jgi:hypothetical protein
MAAMLRGQQGWRPACCQCANNHKLAIGELQKKLALSGVSPEHPEFLPRMQQAAKVGEALAQNPQLAMSGQVPDHIPPIRPADLLVNGSSLCVVCFIPARPTGLMAASSPLVPGNPWRAGG